MIEIRRQKAQQHTSTGPAEQNPASWVQKFFKDGQFYVAIPDGSAVFSEESPYCAKGKNYVFTSSNGIFGAGFCEFARPAKEEKIVADMMDKPYPNWGKPTTKKAITINGYNWTEYHYLPSTQGSKPLYQVYVRQLIIGNRFFSLTATLGEANDSKTEAIRMFLDSFKIQSSDQK